jgi:hypothetical protein
MRAPFYMRDVRWDPQTGELCFNLPWWGVPLLLWDRLCGRLVHR